MVALGTAASCEGDVAAHVPSTRFPACSMLRAAASREALVDAASAACCVLSEATSAFVRSRYDARVCSSTAAGAPGAALPARMTATAATTTATAATTIETSSMGLMCISPQTS